MRDLLETRYRGRRLYVYTTHGHVHIGQVAALEDDVVELVAPDGGTAVHVRLNDISMLRPYDTPPEDVS